MDIRGVGTGPLDQGLPSITRGVPLSKGPLIGADSVAGLLNELSAMQITSLLNIIEPEVSPHRMTVIDALVRDVSNGVLAKLSVLGALDPHRAEALAPIGNDVEALLARLSTAARLDAEALLQDATQIGQSPLLLLAARLIEAGGFANWVHSAEVSRVVVQPAIPAQLDQLLRAAVAAVQDGNTSEALAKLAAFASLDPRRAETLAFEPELAPIAKQVEALLTRLTATALRDAETRLQEATQYAQMPDAAESRVLLAASLIAAGGYANYVRSAAVSLMILDQYGRVRAAAAPGVRRDMMNAFVKNLWRRAPLLVLLLGWLAAGLVGGGVMALFRADLPASIVAWFFEIWALGFLALVSFGFYMRVRNR